MRDVDLGSKSFNDLSHGGWKDLVDDPNEN